MKEKKTPSSKLLYFLFSYLNRVLLLFCWFCFVVFITQKKMLKTLFVCESLCNTTSVFPSRTQLNRRRTTDSADIRKYEFSIAFSLKRGVLSRSMRNYEIWHLTDFSFKEIFFLIRAIIKVSARFLIVVDSNQKHLCSVNQQETNINRRSTHEIYQPYGSCLFAFNKTSTSCLLVVIHVQR